MVVSQWVRVPGKSVIFIVGKQKYEMFDLNLPSFEHKIRTINGKQQIFDSLRKKYVVLSPEEWVRQHFTHFLIRQKNYPAGRIVQEVSILVNGQKKRCDSVVYDRSPKPLVIIEYKAPDVPITQSVFDQISTYNFALHVNYLIVSNGMLHYCCRMDYEQHAVVYLTDIPEYSELK
jgi:hypothetical protein